MITYSLFQHSKITALEVLQDDVKYFKGNILKNLLPYNLVVKKS